MGAYSDAYSTGVSDDVFAVTPSDSTNVSDGTTPRSMIRQLYITTGGTLTYTPPSGTSRQITVPSGFFLTAAIGKVSATGTTATGLLGYA